MKRVFRRLACCSFLGIASIGYFDVEARVTKEVAEAVLPYLMEAAGIPGDVEDTSHTGEEKTTVKANALWYAKSKITAILNMIYTDKGQQQMVKWAVQDQKPDILAGDEGAFKDGWPETSANTNNGDERLFQVLFPCKTGTFTSFADYSSRMGYYILENSSNTVDGLKLFLEIRPDSAKSILSEKKPDKKKKGLIEKCQFTLDQDQNAGLIKDQLDTKIAKIIFIMDICDDLEQLNRILSCHINVTAKSQSEYTCRPVSAIIANKTGDCVETLYRHLINIAIQDPYLDKRHLFHIERLPIPLRLYFGKEKDHLITQKEIMDISESGLTSIDSHNKWQQSLRSIAEYGVYFNTSVAGIKNIARTLHYIAFWNDNKNIVQIENANNSIQLIGDAMNKLAASDNNMPRFLVSSIARDDSDLEWITSKIIIIDLHAKRAINIGICEKEEANFGHAEIISITPTN